VDFPASAGTLAVGESETMKTTLIVLALFGVGVGAAVFVSHRSDMETAARETDLAKMRFALQVAHASDLVPRLRRLGDNNSRDSAEKILDELAVLERRR
jgi:hypothetical protein